ncbi:hypothetical protein H6P81_011440 [Aristolochia fimbriata]|uniref:SAM-dependent MTase RsmB/NOP-type domain-containing protein n=1 Tax=Aristolochia fimbriata TaxID=158543 RepID=A0AAV7ERH9_ARIFI|nr:hypothetical protein H6P81_011440 [Aristolochia fimbriata]
MGGGRKRGRTQRRHFRQNKENVWKRSRPETTESDNPAWEPFATQNPGFEEYYKEQRIVPEDEWDEFIRVLRKPLPAAFRINSSGQFFKDIRSQLENDFVKCLEAEATAENEAEAIRPLPWYPDNLAWHLNFSRMQLRKNQALERFHEFLKQENEIGNITRQEAVSMVPPLFLDVRPHHYVLDMCAAPGSKTFQLLEIIHQSTVPGSLPHGLIIANDVDVQRCNLLIHQTKRMCSANLIVTNHEAQHFPGCLLTSKCGEPSNLDGSNGELVTPHSNEPASMKSVRRQLLFDCVLCDVPCSGDGTLRKAPDIWRKWNSGMGNGLHRLQVQIAMRGLQLLKVGGRMVYSTCSMNPVENEAVVAEVLRKSGGSVELLDVSSLLPQLVRRPGLRKWKVRDKGVWLTSYRQLKSYRKNGIVPSMFPSGQLFEEEEISDNVGDEVNACLNSSQKGVHMNGTENGEHASELENTVVVADTGDDMAVYEEEESSFPLEHCMRIVPHDQNSGAFFIAVLHKVSPLPVVSDNPVKVKKPLTHHKSALQEKTSDLVAEDKPMATESPDEIPEATTHHDKSDQPPSQVPLVEEAVEAKDGQGNEMDVAEACGEEESDLKDTKAEKGRKQMQGKWRGVDPVVFFRDESTMNSIRTFYGISECFPFDGHLVARNNDTHHVKRIYYVSKSVSDTLQLNFQAGQQLKIAALGLKIFERQSSKESSSGSSACSFRISSEGLPLLLPYISKQILSAAFADFEHLLKYRTIKFADFVDPSFGEKASKLLLGCCVVALNQGDQPSPDSIAVDSSTIAIVCWKGRTNVCVMVSEADCQELLQRLMVRTGRISGPSLTTKDNCSEPQTEVIIEEDSDDATDVPTETVEQEAVGE